MPFAASHLGIGFGRRWGARGFGQLAVGVAPFVACLAAPDWWGFAGEYRGYVSIAFFCLLFVSRMLGAGNGAFIAILERSGTETRAGGLGGFALG